VRQRSTRLAHLELRTCCPHRVVRLEQRLVDGDDGTLAALEVDGSVETFVAESARASISSMVLRAVG
jgi:hypothetical protein